MDLAFANAYTDDGATGGHAHIRQFLKHAGRLGHRVFTPAPHPHAAGVIPHGRLAKIGFLRGMDCIYARVEAAVPSLGRFMQSPLYDLVGRPPIIWEINTVPEYAGLYGATDAEVEAEKVRFRAAAPGCALALCVSDAIRDYVRSELGLHNVLTAPNGSDPELFRPTPAAAGDNTFDLVWTGSGEVPWHDFETIAAVAGKLADREWARPVRIHLIGTVHDNAVPDAPHVVRHGAVPYPELPALLGRMDAALCLYRPGPADYSSPLKLFDYMACGLPTLGTPNHQLVGILNHAGLGRCILPHGDPDALLAGIEWLASDPAQCRQIGERLHAMFLERYTWGHTVGRSFDAIAAVVAGR